MSEWISVRDRLPKRGDRVLAVNVDGVVAVWFWSESYGGQWQLWESERKADKRITHWMPLPAPPERLKTLLAARSDAWNEIVEMIRR